MAIAAAPRVAKLGGWPENIDPNALADRIPGLEPAPGFDAGLACALDRIPRSHQRLAAILHAAYTPEAVEQVRLEAVEMDPDSETAWWLSACNVCREGRLSVEDFAGQLRGFELLRRSAFLRREAAVDELNGMYSRVRLRADGIPFTRVDGGMQGAYLAGHRVATMHAGEEDLYFIGTYEKTLGLEDFQFSQVSDDLGRPRSGPVHGSKQFIRCHDSAEFERALAVVRRQLEL